MVCGAAEATSMGTILRNYIHGTAVTTNRALRERGVLLQSGVALALSLKSGYKDRANPESLRCLLGKACLLACLLG